MKKLFTLCALFNLLIVQISASDTINESFAKANKAFAKGNHEKAINLYLELLNSNYGLPQAHFNLAMAYVQTKEYDKAITHFEHAIALKPHYPKAFYHMAKAYDKIDKKDDAQHCYEQAVALEHTFFEALLALGHIYREQSKYEQAISYFERASKANPRDIQTVLELANTLNTINHTEEALEYYLEILQKLPDNPAVLYNTAYTYKKLNKMVEAMPYYNRVLTVQPNHAEAHFSYGLALLVTGNHAIRNWEEGWKEYEWRWKRGDLKLRQYTQPMWDGSDLHGKTLFIWAEQGLGDTFQFIRYAQVAKQMGADKVIVAVQKPLLTFAQCIPYIDQVISIQEMPPEFDVHAPMLSMPYLTKTRLDCVPDEIPYLYAEDSLVAHWRTVLAQDSNFKIGICWQGNPNYSTQFLRQTVAAKSMSIAEFLPLINMHGVSVYSLQKTTGTDQLNDLPDDAPLIVFEGDFDNSAGRFMDTAAVIKNLDLVISIDTSICHFAAGLGVPTWNLLPNPPDWRWLLDCDDTPWYPNMRLFRQPVPGDWKSVIEMVKEELQAHLETNKPLIVHEKHYNSLHG